MNIETTRGIKKEVKGIIRTRDNGEKYITTTRGTVYEIDNEKVYQVARKGHSIRLIGYIA